MTSKSWSCPFCGALNLYTDTCGNCGKGKGDEVARLPDSKMPVGVK